MRCLVCWKEGEESASSASLPDLSFPSREEYLLLGSQGCCEDCSKSTLWKEACHTHSRGRTKMSDGSRGVCRRQHTEAGGRGEHRGAGSAWSGALGGH